MLSVNRSSLSSEIKTLCDGHRFCGYSFLSCQSCLHCCLSVSAPVTFMQGITSLELQPSSPACWASRKIAAGGESGFVRLLQVQESWELDLLSFLWGHITSIWAKKQYHLNFNLNFYVKNAVSISLGCKMWFWQSLLSYIQSSTFIPMCSMFWNCKVPPFCVEGNNKPVMNCYMF